MASEYRVRDFDASRLEDCQRLADMFNDWDSAWPGGFTRGVRETAEHIQESFGRQRRLAICVAECNGELVGFCDLEAQPGQQDMAYVPLLGARLSHHGRGVGKMLLLEVIRRTIEAGYKEVTLGTWPGNTKAVPLYKKTGFNWVPETDVWMRNFIPTALNIPAGRAFFAHRDWYGCFDRDLTVAPDDVKWKGMKVYPYRFRDGDEFLNLVFEEASGGLTALETPAYSVSCSAPVEEAPIGETVPVTWEIASHTGKPLEVLLIAEGDPGLQITVQEKLVVNGEMTVTRDMKVLQDAQPRRGGQPAHRIRTTLLIDGAPVMLETGVKLVYPIEIEYGGQALFTDRTEKVDVILRSRLDRPLTGQLVLDPHPGLESDSAVRDFNLAARLQTQCTFHLTARESGVFYSRLSYQAGDTHGGRPVVFRAFAGDQTLISIEPEQAETAVLESPSLLLWTSLRGGWVGVDVAGARRRVIGMPLAEWGPPFMNGRRRPPLYTVRAEALPSGQALTLEAPSRENPGLVIERSVSLAAGNLIRIEYRMHNGSDGTLAGALRLRHQPWIDRHVTMWLPHGLVREVMGQGGFPQGPMDVLAHGSSPRESWAASEEDGLVVGLIWPEGTKADMEWSHFPALYFELEELPAHSVRVLPPVYVVAGSGDWKLVRSWWRRLVQPSGIVEETTPEPVRLLELQTDPSPALLLSERENIHLELVSRRGVSLSGALSLSGEKYDPEPAALNVEAVDRDRTFTADVQVTGPSRPAAGFLDARFNTGPITESFRIPLVTIGNGESVRVTTGEAETLSVANGLLTYRVAPAFFGSIYALEWNGVNQLLSAYPEARPFVWANPWFGGIHPRVGHWIGDADLSREHFTGRPVERTGDRGLQWTGVQVACTPEHKDFRWLSLEVEYMTLPGSNLLAIVSRLTNRTDARISTPGEAAISAWVQAGGDRSESTAHWTVDGERRHRRRGGFAGGGASETWAAVENPTSGDTIMLIATAPNARAEIYDFSEEGPHMSAGGSIAFAPNETRETLCWLVLCDGTDTLEAYASLSRMPRLP